MGPYIGVFLDEVITKEKVTGLKRQFRLIGHGAYNACGLIGSEYNGLVILDQDAKQVLVDKICIQSSGYSEALAPAVRAEAERLRQMAAGEFENYVTTNPRSRYAQVFDGLRERPGGPIVWKPKGVRAKRVTMALMLKKLNSHGTFGYNEAAKADFLYYTPIFCRRLAKLMGMRPGVYTIRKNAGGIAVSGEVYFEMDGLYVWIQEGWSERGELSVNYRTTPRRGASTNEHGHNQLARFPKTEEEVARLVKELVRVRNLGYQPNLHG